MATGMIGGRSKNQATSGMTYNIMTEKPKTLKEECEELRGALVKLRLALIKEGTSLALWVIVIMTFVLGMVVEHYFSDLTSILFK